MIKSIEALEIGAQYFKDEARGTYIIIDELDLKRGVVWGRMQFCWKTPLSGDLGGKELDFGKNGAKFWFFKFHTWSEYNKNLVPIEVPQDEISNRRRKQYNKWENPIPVPMIP